MGAWSEIVAGCGHFDEMDSHSSVASIGRDEDGRRCSFARQVLISLRLAGGEGDTMRLNDLGAVAELAVDLDEAPDLVLGGRRVVEWSAGVRIEEVLRTEAVEGVVVVDQLREATWNGAEAGPQSGRLERVARLLLLWIIS